MYISFLLVYSKQKHAQGTYGKLEVMRKKINAAING